MNNNVTTKDHRPSTRKASATHPSCGGTPAHRAWQVVMMREIAVKVSDRIFLLSTFGIVALIAAVLGLQAFLDGRTSTYTVVSTQSASAMGKAIAAGATALDDGVVIELREVSDDEAARAAVRASDADAWLHKDGDTWVLTGRRSVEQDLESVAGQVITAQALQAGASAAGTTVAALTQGSTLRADSLEGDAQRAQLVQAVGGVFATLFYFASLMFGTTLASSVVEEKQSRIVEIIATAIPVRQLLAGKVLGNTVLALGQLTLYLAVGLIGLSFSPYSTLVPSLTAPMAWFLVFFLAGFLVLACLWAVAGSLATRQEDLQATTGPLTMFSVALFFASLMLKGQWAEIASYVPPFSAILMPIRLLEGTASPWQGALALALLAGTAAVTIRLSERLYRRSLLQTGAGRLTWRQAWSAQE